MSGDQLQQIGAVLSSHVEMAKGFLGPQFAVSIIARHKQGPFHLLLGDDAELALIQCLSELQRMGKAIIRDGVEQDDPEASPADHMFNLLQECGELFRDYERQHNEKADKICHDASAHGMLGAEITAMQERRTKANRNGEIAGRIEQVLDMVAPERKPVYVGVDLAKGNDMTAIHVSGGVTLLETPKRKVCSRCVEPLEPGATVCPTCRDPVPQ